MAIYFAHTCKACGERVTSHVKEPRYVHVSERYGAIASDHRVTEVVSTRMEEAS